jgi:hypothetical protein
VLSEEEATVASPGQTEAGRLTGPLREELGRLGRAWSSARLSDQRVSAKRSRLLPSLHRLQQLEIELPQVTGPPPRTLERDEARQVLQQLEALLWAREKAVTALRVHSRLSNPALARLAPAADDSDEALRRLLALHLQDPLDALEATYPEQPDLVRRLAVLAPGTAFSILSFFLSFFSHLSSLSLSQL